MNNNDSFAGYHPIINFLYFSLVIVFSMIFMNPVLLIISLVSSFVYSVYLNKEKALKFNIVYMLPIVLMTAIINPAFNHEGNTIIVYINDNPITKESIVFGFASGIMLISVFMWFSCYNKVMTSDKFIYLFGRIIPSLSLVLSMVLRFIPNFKEKLKKIKEAQFGIGHDSRNGNLIRKIKHGITILSIMISLAMENSIVTSDSMKSRGYGLKHRTSFNIYRFTKRDIICLILIVLLSIIMLFGIITQKVTVYYFPVFYMHQTDIVSISIYAAYIFLLNIPIAINVLEDITWKYLKSQI